LLLRKRLLIRIDLHERQITGGSLSISVYIPSYNQKEYLIEAIDSVLEQSLRPSQIIIVDDASSDGSQEVIRGYTARYPNLISAVYHQENVGISKTRIDALERVSGDYVTYVDGDDRILPGKIEKEFQALKTTASADIAFSDNHYIDAKGTRIGTWTREITPPQGKVFLQTITRNFPRANLFRMELLPYPLLRKIGFHDPNLLLLEDWELRIRLTKQYQTVYVDEALSEIRRHNVGLSKLGADKKLAALAYIWKKNQHLTHDLPIKEQKLIHQGIDSWKAKFLRWKAKEILGLYQGKMMGSRREAIRCYQQSWRYSRFVDFDLIFGLIIPLQIYLPMRKKYLETRQG